MRISPILYDNKSNKIPSKQFSTAPFSFQKRQVSIVIPNCNQSSNISPHSNPPLAGGSKSLISGRGIDVNLLNANRYYNLNQDQINFRGFAFEKTVLKTVKKEFMGLGLFKNPEGFTIDFAKIGAEKLAKVGFDITKASDNEVYAYWHALSCQEAYPNVSGGIGTSWVRRYNKKNVPKPNAIFHTLNNPDWAHKHFAENLQELLDPTKHRSLDAPLPGSKANPTLSVITDKDGKFQLTCIPIDTESTGTKKFDKIIQWASVQVKKGKMFKDGIFNTLINPEMPIPPEATAVNGITDEMVKDAPTIMAVLEKILSEHLNKNNGIPVAYNAKFDFNLINNAIREYPFSTGITAKRKDTGEDIKVIAEKKLYKVLDPYILIQRIHPYLGAKKKLSHQYQWLFCKEMENAHDALADVKGTIDVLKYSLYYLTKHRKNKKIPLTLREVLIFQNGGKVENIDIPFDVEDCNKLVNFDKSYLMKPMSVANYFRGYKLNKKGLESLAPEIGEANLRKLMAERIVNQEIDLSTINPAEMEQVEGSGKFKTLSYILESNFRKVIGFAELEPYKGKSKEEIENLITEKSRFYFHGLIEDMHIKNANPKDIPDGNDLPDIEIARRVMKESKEN